MSCAFLFLVPSFSCLSYFLSVCLYICLTFCVPAWLTFFLSVSLVCLTCMSDRQVRQSSLSDFLSVCLFAFLSACLVFLTFCLSVYMSDFLCACLIDFLSVCLSCLSDLYVWQTSQTDSLVCLTFCLSVCLHFCLPVLYFLLSACLTCVSDYVCLSVWIDITVISASLFCCQNRRRCYRCSLGHVLIGRSMLIVSPTADTSLS